MQFGFNDCENLLDQYIIIIFLINILFLSRTYMYTGENHNERGMNRKNLTTTGQCNMNQAPPSSYYTLV